MLLFLDLSYERRRREGRLRTRGDLDEAIVEGAVKRIRPKLMTVVAALLGLLPLMWSTGTGADMMKRVAAPMVGGLATSFALELLVYPVLYAAWKGRRAEWRRDGGATRRAIELAVTPMGGAAYLDRVGPAEGQVADAMRSSEGVVPANPTS
jgi:predicted RND superfamily exporter protein